MIKNRLLQGMLVLVILIFTACSNKAQSGTIEVRDAWARATGMGEMGGHTGIEESSPSGSGFNSAAYMILKNTGNQPDRLIRATSKVAEAVELHKSEMQGEVMTMRPVEFIDLLAGGEVELQPGGLHVMLIGVKENLTPGKKIQLLLTFENAGDIIVEAEVRSP